MKFSAVTLCALALISTVPMRAEETVTVDGAIITIADGWKRVDKDEVVVLTPRELPDGVICTLTLLGGDPFKGSVKDQMALEWKGFEALGTMANEWVADIGSAAHGDWMVMRRATEHVRV